MITGFIFETVPNLLKRFCKYCRQSLVFALMSGIWHFLCRICRDSFIGSVLCEHKTEGKILKGSFVLRSLDAFLRWIEKIIARTVDILTFNRRSSLIIDGIKHFLSLYRFFDFEFFVGLSISFMLLCPGSVWHNVFGLVISVVLLAFMLVYVALNKREALSVKTLGFPFVLFVLASVIGVATASDFSDAFRIFTLFATAFLFCIFTVANVTDAAKLKKMLGAIWFSTCATGAVAFVQRAMGVAVSASLTDLTNNASMPGRVFSTFENPNNYAEFLVMAIPLSFVFCTMIKNDSLRRISYLFLALPFGAILMTYSRSGWVSLALALFIFVFLANKRLLPVIILLGVCAVPFLPQTVLNRIATIGSTNDSSNMYRVYIWRGILSLLKDNWLFGVGLGPVNFRSVWLLYCLPGTSPAPHSHMLFLELWVEMGIAGIISYLMLFFTSVRKGLNALRHAAKPVRLAIIGCVSSLCGIMFSCSAEYVWYYPRVMFFYFIVLGLLMACVNITKNKTELK